MPHQTQQSGAIDLSSGQEVRIHFSNQDLIWRPHSESDSCPDSGIVCQSSGSPHTFDNGNRYDLFCVPGLEPV
jgi:hypothetical protein